VGRSRRGVKELPDRIRQGLTDLLGRASPREKEHQKEEAGIRELSQAGVGTGKLWKELRRNRRTKGREGNQGYQGRQSGVQQSSVKELKNHAKIFTSRRRNLPETGKRHA